MKCSLGISNFLEEISSLSCPIIFLYFFAFFTYNGFLISPCCFLELGIQMDIFFLFSFAFHFSLSLSFFFQLLLRPPQTTILPFSISFLGNGFDHHLLYNVTNLCPQFFKHFIYQIYSLESICHFHCIIMSLP